ncbi:hypothetical protein SDC9_182881 [bioreactor metagenome]|uniref:Uncharacterized protein n=1 Tax=bioreactor metagenome TaxID=1076179 RepID=A0A645HI89_9ZZZZ
MHGAECSEPSALLADDRQLHPLHLSDPAGHVDDPQHVLPEQPEYTDRQAVRHHDRLQEQRDHRFRLHPAERLLLGADRLWIIGVQFQGQQVPLQLHPGHHHDSGTGHRDGLLHVHVPPGSDQQLYPADHTRHRGPGHRVFP